MRSAVIVCSDNRSDKLAAHLAGGFKVFGVSQSGAAEWDKAAWCPLEASKVPVRPDLLFFHLGGNDDRRIPAGCTARLEFAFSGASEPSTSRPRAYTIYSPFTADHCPVTAATVADIVEMLNDKRSDPPWICQRRPRDALLPSLAILCQGYIAVRANERFALAPDDRAVVDRVLARTGWRTGQAQRLAEDVLRLSLAVQKVRVGRPVWWQTPFLAEWGVGSTKEQVCGNEFSASLTEEWRMRGGEPVALELVKSLATSAGLLDADGRRPELTLAVAARAYEAIVDMLTGEAVA